MVLGTALSVIGVGMLVGSVIASTWGGPRRRVPFILGGLVAGGTLLAMSGLRASPVWITVCLFGLMLLVPLINASSQALWQIKVALDFQGRVFATRRVIAQIAAPVSYLLAGLLADNIFEPLLSPDGPLAESVGATIGTGPGRGIAFMFMLMGAGVVATAVAGFSISAIRNLETDLPDTIAEIPAAGLEAAI